MKKSCVIIQQGEDSMWDEKIAGNIAKGKMDKQKILPFITKWGTILVTIGVFIFFTFVNWDDSTNSSMFLTTNNIITILRSISIMSIIALGLN